VADRDWTGTICCVNAHVAKRITEFQVTQSKSGNMGGGFNMVRSTDLTLNYANTNTSSNISANANPGFDRNNVNLSNVDITPGPNATRDAREFHMYVGKEKTFYATVGDFLKFLTKYPEYERGTLRGVTAMQRQRKWEGFIRESYPNRPYIRGEWSKIDFLTSHREDMSFPNGRFTMKGLYILPSGGPGTGESRERRYKTSTTFPPSFSADNYEAEEEEEEVEKVEPCKPTDPSATVVYCTRESYKTFTPAPGAKVIVVSDKEAKETMRALRKDPKLLRRHNVSIRGKRDKAKVMRAIKESKIGFRPRGSKEAREANQPGQFAAMKPAGLAGGAVAIAYVCYGLMTCSPTVTSLAGTVVSAYMGCPTTSWFG
jgi:hypothetical protein